MTIKPKQPAITDQNGNTMTYWDGHRWGTASRTIRNALRFANTSFACQENTWRGLAEKP